jgi:hypothetical protein
MTLQAVAKAIKRRIEIIRSFANRFSMRYILFFLLLVTLSFGCVRTEGETATLQQFGAGTPVKEAFQVRFVFSENAIIQAELDAPHAIEAKENGQEVRIFDKGLHLVFYTPEGEKQSDLTAQQGKFKNQFNDAEVWGDVLMINSLGDRLKCDTLLWNKTKNRIKAKPQLIALDGRTQTKEQAQAFSDRLSSLYLPSPFSQLRHVYFLNGTLGKSGNPVSMEQLFQPPTDGPQVWQVHEPVKIITSKEVIYGDSLDANTDFTEYKIYNINGAINVKEDEI